MTREQFVRALVRRVGLDRLADVLIASDLSHDEMRQLLVTVLAMRDRDDVHIGVVPTLPDAQAAALPPAVLDAVNALFRDGVADAIAHHRPSGRPN